MSETKWQQHTTQDRTWDSLTHEGHPEFWYHVPVAHGTQGLDYLNALQAELDEARRERDDQAGAAGSYWKQLAIIRQRLEAAEAKAARYETALRKIVDVTSVSSSAYVQRLGDIVRASLRSDASKGE